MKLKEVSKLAIEICEELNIPYSFGNGYATLDGIPMDKLDENETNVFQGTVSNNP